MPLQRQDLFVGESLPEEIPPPADKPMLSPGRHYWWNGEVWVLALDDPEGKKALDEEFKAPMIAPLEKLPPSKVPILKPKVDISVPKLIDKNAEPEPAPDLAAEMRKKELEAFAPMFVPGEAGSGDGPELKPSRFPFLDGVDTFGIAAIAATVLLCWMPRFAAVVAAALAVLSCINAKRPTRLAVVAVVIAVPELVVGSVLAHDVAAKADAQARIVNALTGDLQNAADFEHITHVYDFSYGGPGTITKHGWTKPTDVEIEFVDVHRFTYCLSATLKGTTLTVREDGIVSTTPCVKD